MTFHRTVTMEKTPASTAKHSPVPAANLLRAGVPAHMAIGSERYDSIELKLEPETGILWSYMRPLGRPVVSDAFMADVHVMQESLRDLYRSAAEVGQPKPFSYFVFASRTPGIYNLGGDLAHFVDRMRAGDRASIHRYARKCVDLVYQNSVAFDLPIVTMALIQGDALGGGLEIALSYDMIVAERSAKLGLPEILFNLFPGMGAYSFLSRRIGPSQAKEMILSGRIYTAEQLHQIGLIDVLAEDGQGEAAVLEHVRKMSPKHGAHRAFYNTRRRVSPVTHEELRDVVDSWVDAVFELGEADLKKMLRLAGAQDRRIGRTAAAPRIAAE